MVVRMYNENPNDSNDNTEKSVCDLFSLMIMMMVVVVMVIVR